MTEFRYTVLEDRPALTKLWQEAFGDGIAYIDAFFETAYAPERSRVAVADGRIAGMHFWFDCQLAGEKYAYLYAVATDSRFRGQGIATALMEEGEALLRERGYAGVLLSPGSASLFRFYEKRGYETVGFRSEERIAAGEPIPVREVGEEEYAALRRKLLPENGVRQEGENLHFLRRFCRFYAGEGFCAAVYQGEEFLPEYLGDRTKLPGLLGALKMKEASVRMIGNDTPCVMGKWFSPADKKTVYLGFVFD